MTMPEPHLMIRMIRANSTFFVAPRGGFKTTNGIAQYNVDCVYSLPRSTGIIVGPSFEHLGDNTLNALFNALNADGFENGVHYVLGTKPPPGWEDPYIRVDSTKKYDHMVSWHNGTNQFLISMQKKGSANGISAQWGVFDELKLISEADLKNVVFPVFRGNEKYFHESPLFMSKFFATDKLADPAQINWVLAKREQNDYNKINVVYALQVELIKLHRDYNSAGINAKKKLKREINAIEVRLAKLRSNLTFYIESNHTHTIQIMGKRWYADKVESLDPYELKVAIENKDPERPAELFYPDFAKDRHCHQVMDDYDAHKPFIIAADYQHSISPIPIAQIGKIPGSQRLSLNYIDEVFARAPEGLDDAVRKFCDKYAKHQKRTVYYVYDHTAKGKRLNAQSFQTIVVNELKRHKWTVIEVYTGQAPVHFQKFLNTKMWLKEQDLRVMQIRINKVRCPFLIKSINGASAKTLNGETKKDKRFENTTNYPKLDQATTTHFSDVFDMLNHAVLKLNRIKFTSAAGGGLGFR